MNFTEIRKDDDGTYRVYFNENFYSCFIAYYDGDSYFNIYYRLFGLPPKDFYHFLGAKYNAQFKRSSTTPNLIHHYFSKREDAIAFANEVDRRLNYCRSRGDF